MATWYAQKGSCNIDSVSGGTTSDVWNAAAGGGGAWMDISVLTAGGTTVLAANAQTAIAINISIDLGTGRLSNAAEGGTAGGQFTCNAAVTITANIQTGSTSPGAVLDVSTAAGTTTTIIGSVLAPSAATRGLTHSGTGTLSITGDVTAGSTTSRYGVYMSTTGTLNVTGNILAAGAQGILGSTGSTVNVTGNVTAVGNFAGITNSAVTSTNTVTSGNLVYTTTAPAVLGNLTYNPGSTNYIEIPKTTGGAGTWKYSKTIPAASVIEGVNGDGANAPAVGTYHAPDAAEVIDTAVFGAGSATAGTVHQPDAAEVIDTATFGPASGTAGTVHQPDASEVIDTATFGAGSAVSGTFAIPSEDDVRDGEGYGDAGSEFTGNMTLPTVGDVQESVTFGTSGTEFTGTFGVPAEAEVQSGVGYGDGDTEFTGTYVGAGAGGGGSLVNAGLVGGWRG